MKIYELTVNSAREGSVSCYFKDKPRMYPQADIEGVVRYTGERVELIGHRPYRLKELGPGHVFIVVANVESWFIDPVEFEVKEDE